MVYAGDILGDCFNRTKELFFPIRPKYWLRMGFVSLFSGHGGYGNTGGGSGGNNNSDLQNIDWRQAISQFNSEALKFLSQYGYIVGIVFFVFYLISLYFTYLSSVFTFVFMDGIVKKELDVKKSFSANKAFGSQLFFLRLILGLIGMAVFVLMFLPLFSAFFSNTLVQFNLWYLLPMIPGIIIYALIVGLFLFFVYDFVVPIMYLKKYPFKQAWGYFISIAKSQKMEIFVYWLIKLGLTIASGIIVFIGIICLIIPVFLIALMLLVFVVLVYFLSKAMTFEILWVVIAIILALIFIMAMIYALAVIFVPVPAFFRMYSIEMAKKLDGKKIRRN